MVGTFETAIVIVGFRNPGDVVGCLRALSLANEHPDFEVFVAENGGPASYDALIASLLAADGPCVSATEDMPQGLDRVGVRRCRLRLARPDGGAGQFVNVSEMEQNLGYAGGVNAWLRPLLNLAGWRSAWVLNPDTAPAVDALAELAGYATNTGRGLVGSRLVLMGTPNLVQTRGLGWRKLRATVEAIDFGAPASSEPATDHVERRLDAPSGASIYATRSLIDRVGLMSEHYFLYYEDLDWGVRAKESGGMVGYAHRSVVYHRGGSTIGSASRRIDRSQLSVYLEARNNILFVRARHPRWLVWTVLMGILRSAVYVAAGATENARASLRGLWAGVSHEVGRPIPFP